MPIKYKGKKYSSKKHPILEYIFRKKNPNLDTRQKVISFTLGDISEGYRACGIKEPASISNTILDLTRKETSKESRVPEIIYILGYDLRKKTGLTPDGGSYAGEFVYVGKEGESKSWLKWPNDVESKVLSSSPIPTDIRELLRNDEAALFSVMDYCDVLSQAFNKPASSILRVQHPMKWQPSEIDGLYFSSIDGVKTLYPVEAKSLATQDDVNLEQMKGGLETVSSKFAGQDLYIVPLAVQMIENGLRIAVFKTCKAGSVDNLLEFDKAVFVSFDPKLYSWRKTVAVKQLRKPFNSNQDSLL